MAYRWRDRLANAWSVFRNRDPTQLPYQRMDYWDLGMSSSYRPDRARLTMGNERSITTSIYNRIAIDVSSITVQHVRLGENDIFQEVIESSLNRVLTLEANIDQSARAFIQDVVISMIDEGAVAIVPTIINDDPDKSDNYEIYALRTGRIMEWFPYHVRVRLYNELKGLHEDLLLTKESIAIVENPMYSVMNEPNSTLMRLKHKLNLLDVLDDKVASGKLDMIIQLPFEVKTPIKKEQAEERIKNIEMQLSGSQYGIAYMGATERITQLNRPVENNLMAQVKDLTSMLYGQLGITEEIMNGTADEKVMLNYYNRTIEPILGAIVIEMKRKFLSRTAITQKQSIEFFRDPFKLVPVSELANIADKFTRNEILSSNEVRSIINFRPVQDARADELRNKNITAKNDQLPVQVNPEINNTNPKETLSDEGRNQNGV